MTLVKNGGHRRWTWLIDWWRRVLTLVAAGREAGRRPGGGLGAPGVPYLLACLPTCARLPNRLPNFSKSHGCVRCNHQDHRSRSLFFTVAQIFTDYIDRPGQNRDLKIFCARFFWGTIDRPVALQFPH